MSPKSIYYKLGLISAIFTLSLLIVLPRVSIDISNPLLIFSSYLGGYYVNFGNGKFVLDLRDFKKGLDLEGGIRVVMQADVSKIEEAQKASAVESAKEVISRRINFLGVTEPVISTLKVGDDYRIIVEIPGVEDTASAIALIGQTAQLRFKTLKADLEWTEEKFFDYYQKPDSWEDSGITGANLRGVDVVMGQDGDLKNSGKPQIQLKFTPEGRQKFSDLAKKNINKPVALFLDQGQYPLSAPVISPELADGLVSDPVISGNFTFETAKNLSIQLRAGALPVPVSILQQETIGATLGSDSINKSFFAGVVGIALVFVFLIYKYRSLGFIAGISLVLYALITLAIFKIIPVVLTLPGIAGFILSIGMATDANILIFERMREELLWGKSKEVALDLGFERAWSSIKDSNVSSLITCFILFQFGSGPVRGFAVTLALGILVSLFSSIFVVRTILKAFRS